MQIFLTHHFLAIKLRSASALLLKKKLLSTHSILKCCIRPDSSKVRNPIKVGSVSTFYTSPKAQAGVM